MGFRFVKYISPRVYQMRSTLKMTRKWLFLYRKKVRIVFENIPKCLSKKFEKMERCMHSLISVWCNTLNKFWISLATLFSFSVIPSWINWKLFGSSSSNSDGRLTFLRRNKIRKNDEGNTVLHDCIIISLSWGRPGLNAINTHYSITHISDIFERENTHTAWESPCSVSPWLMYSF